MNAKLDTERFRVYADRAREAAQQELYEEAVAGLIEGLKEAHKQNKKNLQRSLLHLLKNMFVLIENQYGKFEQNDRSENLVKQCSFCGQSGNNLKLLVGAMGSICENCASNAHQYFTSEAVKKS